MKRQHALVEPTLGLNEDVRSTHSESEKGKKELKEEVKEERKEVIDLVIVTEDDFEAYNHYALSYL